MSENDKTKSYQEKLQQLKTMTSIVYLCQVCSFVLAGLPLLIGIAINLIKRDEVKGTWLESHFNWQIKTAWMTLAGFAVAGLLMFTGLGYMILLPVIIYFVYRIAVGWTALTADKAIGEEN